MPQCKFIKARSLSQALELMAEKCEKAALIAGGTDLLIERRQDRLTAPYLIDISDLDEIQQIVQEDGMIRIGGGASHSACIAHPLLQSYAPLLVEAQGHIGSLQIRNRATIAGNIVTAAACADTIPPLIALNAVCELQSQRGGVRTMPLVELTSRANLANRRPDEILTAVLFKPMAAGAKHTFIKLGRRNAVAKSRMSLALWATQNGDKVVTDFKFVVGAVAPEPLPCQRVEELLIGQVPTQENINQAGAQTAREMIEVTGRRWSTEYKEPVLEALTVRALGAVLEV